MLNIPIALDNNSAVPLYEQLTAALRSGISYGQLKPGTPLPSTRELAKRLGVSRSTAIRSYELLTSQGYIETDPGKSTVVTKLADLRPVEISTQSEPEPEPWPVEDVLTDFGSRVAEAENVVLLPGLNYGAPSKERLPMKQWRQCLARQLRSQSLPIAEYPQDPLGYRPLRRAISTYLSRFRSIQCSEDQVVVFAGPMSALDFISRLFIDNGDNVLVENPGQRRPPRILRAHGANLIPIDVDQDGIDDAAVRATTCNAKLLYCTPAHQYPTGAVLSFARRQSLLEWAAETHTLIVEDDYDTEYTYVSRRLPPLLCLDKRRSVVYLSSFWRVLFPLVRISFAVFPEQFMPAVTKLSGMLEWGVPALEQAALSDFIDEGHLEHEIRKVGKQYATRRQALIEALISNFGRSIWLTKEGSSMHLLVRFRIAATDQQIMEAATAADFKLVSTSTNYQKESVEREYLIPFGHISEEDILAGVSRFAQKLL